MKAKWQPTLWVVIHYISKLTDLDIRTRTKLFWDDRIFMTWASPLSFLFNVELSASAPWPLAGSKLLKKLMESEEWVLFRNPVGLRKPWGVRKLEGGAVVSLADFKSVNDLELPSLRRGGIVLSPDLDACSPRGESKDDLPAETGLLTTISGGVMSWVFSDSSATVRCARPGHTYSMIRLPTLASIWSRSGCNESSNAS